MEIVRNLWMAAALVYFSWWDIRTQQLPKKALTVFLAAGLPVLLWRTGSSGWTAFLTLAPGILFGAVSLLTEEELGTGDVLLMLAAGAYLAGEEMIRFLFLGMFAAMIWAGGVFLKKRNRRQTMPLAPFLLAGYMGGVYFWNI